LTWKARWLGQERGFVSHDEAVFWMARLSLCKRRLHHAVTAGGNESAIFLQALSQSEIGTVFAGSQPTRSCSPSEEVDFPENGLKAPMLVIGLVMPIGTEWLGLPMVWLRKRLLPPEEVIRRANYTFGLSGK